MDRLTVKSEIIDGYILKCMCGFGRDSVPDDEDDCLDICNGNCDECGIQQSFDKLAAYENTGLTPEQIIAMKERLVVDPSGTDKIDELEEAIDFVRLECENLKMENKRLREFIGKTEGNKDER